MGTERALFSDLSVYDCPHVDANHVAVARSALFSDHAVAQRSEEETDSSSALRM